MKRHCRVCGAEMVEKKRVPRYSPGSGQITHYNVLSKCPNATFWNVMFGDHFFGEWDVEYVSGKEVK